MIFAIWVSQKRISRSSMGTTQKHIQLRDADLNAEDELEDLFAGPNNFRDVANLPDFPHPFSILWSFESCVVVLNKFMFSFQ